MTDKTAFQVVIDLEGVNDDDYIGVIAARFVDGFRIPNFDVVGISIKEKK